jgi:hypothetical protein
VKSEFVSFWNRIYSCLCEISCGKLGKYLGIRHSPSRAYQYARIFVCSGDITSYKTPRQRILRVMSEATKFAT